MQHRIARLALALLGVVVLCAFSGVKGVVPVKDTFPELEKKFLNKDCLDAAMKNAAASCILTQLAKFTEETKTDTIIKEAEKCGCSAGLFDSEAGLQGVSQRYVIRCQQGSTVMIAYSPKRKGRVGVAISEDTDLMHLCDLSLEKSTPALAVLPDDCRRCHSGIRTVDDFFIDPGQPKAGTEIEPYR